MLEQARDYGFLGPGPVERHLAHARAFSKAWEEARAAGWAAPSSGGDAPSLAVDLGSGAGVPGLVLAAEGAEETSWLLVEANQRRARFLAGQVDLLGLAGVVTVVAERAELVAHDERYRGRADVVMARGFGAPAVTAECAVGFLRRGGVLVVSEPPIETPTKSRWPAEPLAQLGLEGQQAVVDGSPFELLTLRGTVPERLPRRVGVPSKRPLFGDG